VAATSSGLTIIVDYVQMLQINAASWMARSICWKVHPQGQWRMPVHPFQALIIDPQKMAPYAWALQVQAADCPSLAPTWLLLQFLSFLSQRSWESGLSAGAVSHLIVDRGIRAASLEVHILFVGSDKVLEGAVLPCSDGLSGVESTRISHPPFVQK
jgi:hypothetical protein